MVKDQPRSTGNDSFELKEGKEEGKEGAKGRPFQGGKTFCASFCASFIAGSRRAFLCVDCTVCLFVNSFCLQFDDWMLKENGKNHSERMLLSKEKKLGLKFNLRVALIGLEQLGAQCSIPGGYFLQ